MQKCARKVALNSQHVSRHVMCVYLAVNILGACTERNEAFIGYAEQTKKPEAASVLLVSEFGKFELKLLPLLAPNTCKLVHELAARGKCATCRFYRHEPVPPKWGENKFFGPPYALLQGSLLQDFTDTPAFENQQEVEVKRGHACIIPGSKEFFIATADHPEWGHSHTVFAMVEDLADEPKFPFEPFHTLTSGEIITRWLNSTSNFHLELHPSGSRSTT